jgi:hypothetical protein
LVKLRSVAFGSCHPQQVTPSNIASAVRVDEPGLLDSPPGSSNVAAVKAEFDEAVRGVDNCRGEMMRLNLGGRQPGVRVARV